MGVRTVVATACGVGGFLLSKSLHQSMLNGSSSSEGHALALSTEFSLHDVHERLTTSPSTVPLSEIASFASPGDIVLFDRPCHSLGMYGGILCSFAKLSTKSRWDHIGIVVHSGGNLEVLEASLNGVKTYSLRERIQKSRSKYIALRKLELPPEQQFWFRRQAEQNLQAFTASMLGTPYEDNVMNFLRAIWDTASEQKAVEVSVSLARLAHEIKSYAEELERSSGLHDKKRELEQDLARFRAQSKMSTNAEDLSAVFCSELVAAAYKSMGLLPASYPPSAEYTPADFGERRDDSLPLMHGARLSPEIFVTR